LFLSDFNRRCSREGAKVIKRYHAPSTPYEQALA
jgi:hypothetical protein